MPVFFVTTGFATALTHSAARQPRLPRLQRRPRRPAGGLSLGWRKQVLGTGKIHPSHRATTSATPRSATCSKVCVALPEEMENRLWAQRRLQRRHLPPNSSKRHVPLTDETRGLLARSVANCVFRLRLGLQAFDFRRQLDRQPQLALSGGEVMEGSGPAADGSASRSLPATHWSLIATAREGRGGCGGGADALCRAYWQPLYAFARRRGEGQDEVRTCAGLLSDFIGRGDPSARRRSGAVRSYS